MGESITTRANARERLEHYLNEPGPYTHNLISFVLGRVAKRYGSKEVNKLIREYRLSQYGFREKVEPPHRKHLGPVNGDLERSLRRVKGD